MNIDLAVKVLSNWNGWCSEEKMRKLYELVHQTHRQFGGEILTVEQGVFAGKSLFPMAIAHKELQAGVCWGIETFDNVAPLEGKNHHDNDKYWANVDMDVVYAQFLQGNINFKLRGYCKWLHMKSYEAAKYFEDNTVTLCHLDSAHNEEVITKELESWTPKLKVGALLICDDTSWPETKEGYAKLPYFGYELMEDFKDWQVWQK